MGADEHPREELAIRTSAAALTGLASLLGPDATVVATTLQPITESALQAAARLIRERWNRNSAEMLADAAQAASESPEELLIKAVSDDRRHELLARAIGTAQDTALRDKRRALGRALAAGIAGDDAQIDDELMFMRAIADLDAPHIRVLALMASEQAQAGQQSGSPFHAGWSPATIAARDPGLRDTVPALMWTLEAHGLIAAMTASTPWLPSRQAYNLTAAGRRLLDRLEADSENSQPSAP
jgi:hypothetical protein